MKGVKKMIHPHRINLFLAAMLVVFLASTFGYCEDVRLQRAVPYGILNRVFPIEYKSQGGTCFAIDLEGRQYIITARHIVQGIKSGETVRILVGESWYEVVVKPIFPQNEKIDIAALATNVLIAPKMDITASDDGIVAGQEVYFLGFPFGLTSRFEKPTPGRFAFIKKGILSAIDSRPEAGPVFYLDAHNNPGFSGGPVIFGNFSKNDRLQIAGVISGYRIQPNEVEDAIIDAVSPTGETKKKVIHYVRENTGIVLAYGLKDIIESIKGNPIGLPVSEEKGMTQLKAQPK
jgi:hypothetical protein